MTGVNNYNNGVNMTPSPLRLVNFGQRPGAPGMATLASDTLRLTGGAGPEAAPQQDYAQFVASTIQMMSSQDLRQRYQAIVNITKMQPAEAIPLLQRAQQDPDPQVRQLAQRALNVMQGMNTAQNGGQTQQPAAQPQQPAPQTGAPSFLNPGGQPQQPPAQQGPIQGLPQAAPGQPAAQNTPAQAPQQPMALPQMPTAPPAGVSTNPQDNLPVIQVLYQEITGNDPKAAAQAIAQIDQYAQTNKDDVTRVLLNLLATNYEKERLDPAIAVLAKMKSKEAEPFLLAISGSPSYHTQTRTAAAQALKAIGAPAEGGQAAATAQGGDTYAVRGLEYQIQSGSLQQAGQALAQLDQLAEANKQEATRVLLTVLATRYEKELIVPAIAILTKMKSKEAIPFLQAITASPSHATEARKAATQAVMAISRAQ